MKLINIFDYNMHKISILGWFLKDRVALKTFVMADEKYMKSLTIVHRFAYI